MKSFRIALLASSALLLGTSAWADELDDYVVVQMQRRQIPGLSLAIFDGGKIVKANGYGVIERGRTERVTTETLFQAGSISKPLTAAAALVLVDRGRLILDEDVNLKLKTWKVPDNEFTGQGKVTLRELLSHSAGTSSPSFDGYGANEALPSLVQILNGEKPAKSPPIRVEAVPGAQWNYSSGGYLIVQQLLIDTAGKPFPEIMRANVLAPLGMRSSTFEQPLPASRSKRAATGHDDARTVVPGRWHVYPEMAAGGLWTTASDVARFAIGIQQSLNASPNGLLLPPMAKQMVTAQKGGSGLGVFVRGQGSSSSFSHPGRDEGFDSVFVAFIEGGKGVAMMINANDDSRFVPRMFGRIAELYHWPGSPGLPQRGPAAIVEPGLLARYEGRYQMDPDSILVLAARNGRLYTQTSGMDDEEFVPDSQAHFVSAERDAEVSFDSAADGAVVSLHWKDKGAEKVAPRIAK